MLAELGAENQPFKGRAEQVYSFNHLFITTLESLEFSELELVFSLIGRYSFVDDVRVFIQT